MFIKKISTETLGKLEFVIHKIIEGIIFWILICAFTTFQRYVMFNIKNMLLNAVLYMLPILTLSWYLRTISKRSQWKPMGQYTGVISTGIVIGVAITLLLTVGALKITI
jgi:hypothetical protein